MVSSIEIVANEQLHLLLRFVRNRFALGVDDSLQCARAITLAFCGNRFDGTSNLMTAR